MCIRITLRCLSAMYLCRRQLIEPPYTGGISTTDIIQEVGDRALAKAEISEAANEAPASP